MNKKPTNRLVTAIRQLIAAVRAVDDAERRLRNKHPTADKLRLVAVPDGDDDHAEDKGSSDA